MAEHPGDWDRLTAALHGAEGSAEERWAFLSHLGLAPMRPIGWR